MMGLGLGLSRQAIAAIGELGPELVQNGDFSSSTGWSTDGGWTISSGTARSNSWATNLIGTLTEALQQGQSYRVVYTLLDPPFGPVHIGLGNVGFTTIQLSAGTFSEDVLISSAPSPTTRITVYDTDGSQAWIDNISVKKIL